jgi:Uma2 family endonuclease
MTTAQLVSVDEYLHTSYEPDAEYVEGRIVHRAMPQQPHSEMQGFLVRILYAVGKPLGYRVWPEQRLQTRPDLFRVPDLCVTKGRPNEKIYTSPPFLCIEILSPDDKAVDVRAKVDEYLAFGVPYVWVIDPESRRGEVHTKAGIERVQDGIFRAGEIEVNVENLD